MNSWEIIKHELTKGSRPGTFGRAVAMKQCADLFINLSEKLNDREAATESFNKDQEVSEAISAIVGIQVLRDFEWFTP